MESRAKLEVDRLRDHLNGMLVSTEMAEEQAVLMKKKLKWVESMTRTQYSAFQKQYHSMRSSLTVFMVGAWEI